MLDGLSADTMQMMVYVVISLKWLTGFDLEVHFVAWFLRSFRRVFSNLSATSLPSAP